MTPLGIEQVMNALGLILLTVITFLSASFSKRLQRHEARTQEALQKLAAIMEGLHNNQQRIERIDNKLDIHLGQHRA